MIQEAYCSLEVAKLLKEKGFDIPVNYEYHYIIDIAQFHKKKHNFNGIEYRNCSSEWYSAPTHQMTMAWLREVHNIFVIIEPHMYDYINEKNSSYVYSLWQGDNYYENPSSRDFPSYEETVEAAIKYVLENLI